MSSCQVGLIVGVPGNTKQEPKMPKQVLNILKMAYLPLVAYLLFLAKMEHTESDGHVGSCGVLLMSLSSNGAPNFIKWMPEHQRGELIVPQHFP